MTKLGNSISRKRKAPAERDIVALAEATISTEFASKSAWTRVPSRNAILVADSGEEAGTLECIVREDATCTDTNGLRIRWVWGKKLVKNENMLVPGQRYVVCNEHRDTILERLVRP